MRLGIIAICVLLAASILFFLRSADQVSLGVDSIPDGPDNVARVRSAGHPIPPLEDFWIEPPAPMELMDAIVPPAISGEKICVQRLWIPRKIVPYENVDPRLIGKLQKTPRGPQHLALAAHFSKATGNLWGANNLMRNAREWFFDESRDARVYCSFRSRHLLAYLLALDWIEWESPDEFERAFEFVRSHVAASLAQRIGGGHVFKRDGHWNASHPIESAYYLEQLLALVAYDVNSTGESHTWATDRLNHWGSDLSTDPESLYSTVDFANVLSLLSRGGGGREYGQQEKTRGLGGYEIYFSTGGLVQLRAFDTATNGKWDLLNRCLYFRTRHVGLLTESDSVVGGAVNTPLADAILSSAARLFRQSSEIGGVYQHLLEQDGGASSAENYLTEFQALAGPAPSASSPTSEPFAGRVGSRWHYRDDPSSPDSTFRMWIVNRDIENFRIAPDERCLMFAIGDVALVDGHANRTYVTGALANGIHFAPRTAGGEPYVGDPQFWPTLASHHPYWSPDRALDAASVLRDPDYLVGSDGPPQTTDAWSWTRDYSKLMTRDVESGIAGKVGKAVAEYHFDPQQRRLEIIDTVQADDDVYVGWHFSPTHSVSLTPNGFRFGDDEHEIRVAIEGLDGTELRIQRRSQWQHDGYTLPLEWHEQLGAEKRIAENIGFTPKVESDEYRVRVVLSAHSLK